MDLAAMGATTAAICLERLAPRGAWYARISGLLLVGAALMLLIRQAATA
jgi:glucose dehydrogenase